MPESAAELCVRLVKMERGPGRGEPGSSPGRSADYGKRKEFTTVAERYYLERQRIL